MKATNSLRTILVPNRPPATPASFHGTPIRYMTGENSVADQRLEAQVGHAEPAADTAEHAIGQRHQRDERQHHRADRDRQLDAGLRALGGGHDDVGRAFALLKGIGDLDLVLGPCRRRRLRAASSSAPGGSSGMISLAIRIPPGADMKAAASRKGRYCSPSRLA